MIYQKPFLLSLIIGVLLISSKWVFSYLNFDEDITLRIINETGDTAYYPIIHSFSNFNFSPSYSNEISELNLISFPILSLIINSFFLKFTGNYSFILLEFLSVSFFIYIFYNIFKKLGFTDSYSFACSTFLFASPFLIQALTFINFEPLNLLILNLENFYSLRFPRPIITNLYFFAYIYFLIDFYLEKKNYTNKIFFITIIIGISFNTFFYLFFIEIIFLIFVVLIKFKQNIIRFLLDNFKSLIISLLILCLFVGFFQIQLFYSEIDYIERLGVFSVDSIQKQILLNYIYSFFSGYNFLILILVNTVLYFLIRKNITSILFYLFIASILSPLIFIISFSKGVDYYHFFSWIVVTSYIFQIFTIFYLINQNLLKRINFISSKKFMSIIIVLVIVLFNFSQLNKFSMKYNDLSDRENLSSLVDFIKYNQLLNNKELKILNMNEKLSLWLILNDYSNFSFLPISLWTSKTNNMLEHELFSVANFLKLNAKDFNQLIQNDLKNWRFQNTFVRKFFGRKYMANILVNYNNDLNDYEEIEKKYIISNSIISTHQVIIPKSEIIRLSMKFDNTKNKSNPDILIIDKDGLFKINNFEDESYCKIFQNKKYLIFQRIKLESSNCL